MFAGIYKKIRFLYLRAISLCYAFLSTILCYKREIARVQYFFISKRSYFIIKEWDIRYRQCLRHALKKNFIVATRDNMLRYKTCDTLFVLASGPSINDITPEQWDTIAACDSIGFNYFFLHSHVPTYYNIEFRPSSVELLMECYRATAPEFKKIPVMTNMYNLMDLPAGAVNQLGQQFKNLYVTVPKMFKGASKQNLEEILLYQYLYRNYAEDNLVVHYRASLMMAITFGVLLGYKNVVLAGVDMDSNDYFFYDEKKYCSSVAEKVRKRKKQKIERYLKQKAAPVTMHKTLDPDIFKELPLDQAVLVLNESVLEPLGINLFLLSQKSVLYPALKLYDH